MRLKTSYLIIETHNLQHAKKLNHICENIKKGTTTTTGSSVHTTRPVSSASIPNIQPESSSESSQSDSEEDFSSDES